MRKFFYSFLFVLLLAASFVVVKFFLTSQDLQISEIKPLLTCDETPAKTASLPETERKEPEKNVVSPNPQTVPAEKKTPAAPEKSEKQSLVAVTAPEKNVSEKKFEVIAEKAPDTEKKNVSSVSGNISENVKVTEAVPAKTPAVPKEQLLIEKKNSADTDRGAVERVEYQHGWIEDFEPDGHLKGVKYVDNWKREGGVIFTPKTNFYLRYDRNARAKTVLVVESRKSSAVFACDLTNIIDLNKTPILRWRWRVKKLPPFGDGRHRTKDDQAIGIYIGTGTAFNQKSISYRWETETPVGHWGRMVYPNLNVWFYCLRNKNDGLDVWYEECRNVRQDFLNKYGYVPEKIALVICGNSQNSQSDALAEIDYIGFYKEIRKKGKK